MCCCFFHERIQEIKKVGKELGIVPTVIRDEELKARGFGGGWGPVLLGPGLSRGLRYLGGWGVARPHVVLSRASPHRKLACVQPPGQILGSSPSPGERRGSDSDPDSDPGSRRVQVLPRPPPLQPPPRRSPAPQASPAGPFCSSNTQAHIPSSCALVALSPCDTLPQYDLTDHFFREPSLTARPIFPASQAPRCSDN